MKPISAEARLLCHIGTQVFRAGTLAVERQPF